MNESTSGRHILVVDDDRSFLQIMKNVLHQHGYRVTVANDGESALRLLRFHPGRIDLLLVDIVMPKMSGLSLAEKILLHRPTMMVLFMSGLTNAATIPQGLRQRTSFVQKTPPIEGLVKQVARMFEGRRRRPRHETAATGGGATEGAGPGPVSGTMVRGATEEPGRGSVYPGPDSPRPGAIRRLPPHRHPEETDECPHDPGSTTRSGVSARVSVPAGRSSEPAATDRTRAGLPRCVPSSRRSLPRQGGGRRRRTAVLPRPRRALIPRVERRPCLGVPPSRCEGRTASTIPCRPCGSLPRFLPERVAVAGRGLLFRQVVP